MPPSRVQAQNLTTSGEVRGMCRHRRIQQGHRRLHGPRPRGGHGARSKRNGRGLYRGPDTSMVAEKTTEGLNNLRASRKTAEGPGKEPAD